jgi:hypothetical protein
MLLVLMLLSVLLTATALPVFIVPDPLPEGVGLGFGLVFGELVLGVSPVGLGFGVLVGVTVTVTSALGVLFGSADALAESTELSPEIAVELVLLFTVPELLAVKSVVGVGVTVVFGSIVGVGVTVAFGSTVGVGVTVGVGELVGVGVPVVGVGVSVGLTTCAKDMGIVRKNNT